MSELSPLREAALPYEVATPPTVTESFGNAPGYNDAELTNLTVATSNATDHVPESYAPKHVIAPLTTGEYMSYFEEAARAPEQPQEISDRAAGIVLDAVAKFPQAAFAAPVLIADRLLDNFDPDPHTNTGVGMLEMARMIPDPEACTATANRMHGAFKIPLQLTPAVVMPTVSGFTVDSLEKIRMTTVEIADRAAVALPSEITDDSVMNVHVSGTLRGPWTVNKAAVGLLHDVLTEMPALRNAVAAHIKAQAAVIRDNSRAQQAHVQNRMNLLQQFRPNQRD